ncbi:hypothetical protein [Bacillus badius]|uniref:Phage protein n=1 Tax=Bacillus badius TaxID=1455 RepID=A0ABR5B167_BACBA|nr:hypothetical protein [Bacillus badius]KIL80734.1 hypothetical protein SD77_0582 [Bacillus badius]MED4715337.1 hypothetical protein [Bacillus badius]
MIELNYSPSQLLELYNAPRPFKALLYASIGYRLEMLAEEAKKAEQERLKGGK